MLLMPHGFEDKTPVLQEVEVSPMQALGLSFDLFFFHVCASMGSNGFM